MKLCDRFCIPCCDYCIHVKQEMIEEDDGVYGAGPIGCNFHKDEEHQFIAIGCSYCNDFECFRCNSELNPIEVDIKDYSFKEFYNLSKSEEIE